MRFAILFVLFIALFSCSHQPTFTAEGLVVLVYVEDGIGHIEINGPDGGVITKIMNIDNYLEAILTAEMNYQPVRIRVVKVEKDEEDFIKIEKLEILEIDKSKPETEPAPKGRQLVVFFSKQLFRI